MNIQKVNNISFGYSHPLKTLFKKGKLPIKKGLYGGELTIDTVSLEHIIPHSQGGKTVLSNLALATKKNNNLRGDKPLKDFLTKEMLDDYIEEFEKINLPYFNGKKYIEELLKTIGGLLKWLSILSRKKFWRVLQKT